MSPPKTHALKASLPSGQVGIQVNARLSQPLVESAKALAGAANQTLTEFIKQSIEHEISRRTLCKPIHPVALTDIQIQLDRLGERLAQAEARDRLKIVFLESIAQALDLDA